MNWTGRTMAVAVAAACAVAGAAAPALGAPTFAPEQVFKVWPGHQPFRIAVGPLNGDTDPDVVATGNGALGSVRGAAGTAFSGAFTQNAPAPEWGMSGLVLADADVDGRNDAVVNAYGDGLFTLSRGLGTGAFEAPVTVKTSGWRGGDVATADFNRDGDPDVAALADSTTSTAGGIVIMHGAAGSSFVKGPVLPMPRHSSRIYAGKLNGDGNPDLIALHSQDDTLRIFYGATFSWPVGYVTGDHPRDVAIGSLNGDAHPDFVLALKRNVAFYFGKGDGTFTRQYLADDYDDVQAVRIADTDGDGHNDLVVSDLDSNGAGGRVVVLAGRSTGSFEYVLTLPYRVGALLQVADLDADRAPDLVAATYERVRSVRNTTPKADLAAKLAAPATTTTTADAKYTLGTTNAGPTTATGVVLTLDLPASFTYKAAPTGCTYTSILRRVTCTVGSLGSGATASRVITVRPTAKGQFPATARVTSARGDFNRANNAVAAITTVN